ncbi:MAG TPA: hypothetical protein VEH31_04665 [Streptosporangiaceae bacterium]|nr:hypothetical protein [Streptosporangiaceae bacterium]
MRYVDELKQSPPESAGSWRRTRRRRKYLRDYAKKLSAAACASDPAAAISALGDFYQDQCQLPGKRAGVAEKTQMAETLMRACRQLALGRDPGPITFSPRWRGGGGLSRGARQVSFRPCQACSASAVRRCSPRRRSTKLEMSPSDSSRRPTVAYRMVAASIGQPSASASLSSRWPTPAGLSLMAARDWPRTRAPGPWSR